MATVTRLSKTWLSSILNDFFSLFFPNFCLGCKDGLVKGEEILCTHCLSELPKVDYFDVQDNPLVNRFVGRVPIHCGWSLLKFQKSGIVQNLLHELKYNNHPEIGERLGRILGVRLTELGVRNGIDILIPVPLHKNRKRVRGYNQSAAISKGLSNVIEKPFSDDVLIRISSTKTQTKKSRIERWENVNNAFRVVQPDAIKGKHVLLVDDVVTTGATTEACAKCLLNAGASLVSIVCLAEVS
jgi:ComF family protein